MFLLAFQINANTGKAGAAPLLSTCVQICASGSVSESNQSSLRMKAWGRGDCCFDSQSLWVPAAALLQKKPLCSFFLLCHSDEELGILVIFHLQFYRAQRNALLMLLLGYWLFLFFSMRINLF